MKTGIVTEAYTEEMINVQLDNVLSPIIQNLSMGDYNRLLHDLTHSVWEALQKKKKEKEPKCLCPPIYETDDPTGDLCPVHGIE